ncbi:MAG: hypothetical protein MN733_19500, partial [Nitrososphaera sp.]|nr:hypothetical protein [Nitrososphaera sp.]
MQKVVLPLFVLSVLILGFANSLDAMAHEEACRGDVCVVGGWVNEPPLVDEFNGIELTVTRNLTGEPIPNALNNVAITVKKGTLTKTLDFVPTEEAGVFSAEILPTQTGQYAVQFRGTIAGQAFDTQIEIED